MAPEDEALAFNYSGDVVDEVSGLRSFHPWFLPLVSDSSRQDVIGELTSPSGTRQVCNRYFGDRESLVKKIIEHCVNGYDIPPPPNGSWIGVSI